jgi:uncharacterized protein
MGNTDLVARALGAIRDGDDESARELIADDFVWHVPGRSPIAGDARGPAEFGQKFRRLVAAGLRPEILATFEGDEHAVFLQRNMAEADGHSLDVKVVNVFTVEDERLTRMDTYFGDQAALDEFWTAVLG